MEVNPLPGNSGYAPRNALNADQLKRAITARSQARGDTEPVRRWLLNHFYRHVVSNFEPARRIHTLQDAAVVQGETPLPPWLTRYFDNLEGAANHTAGTPLVWVDPDDPKVLEQEALLVEFLGSRQGTALEGKLDRINCPQALQQWQKEHTPADCIAVAIVRTQTGWLRLEDVTEPSAQTRLVALYPQLFSRLPAPSALVEWLVAARQPELLEQVTPQAASVRYAARHVLNATRAPGLSDEHHYRTEDVQWVDMSSAQAADILHWQTRTR